MSSAGAKELFQALSLPIREAGTHLSDRQQIHPPFQSRFFDLLLWTRRCPSLGTHQRPEAETGLALPSQGSQSIRGDTPVPESNDLAWAELE